MGRLKNYFFKTLPDFFRIHDTYPDANGKGILERFLDTLQEDMETTEKDITSLSSAIFPGEAKEEHLDYISAFLGTPPLLILDEEDLYRFNLSHIIGVYKYKGTEEGVRRFFTMWGFDTELIYTTPLQSLYDIPLHYDDGNHYDQGCSVCIEVQLNLQPFTQEAADAITDPKFPSRVAKALRSMAPIFWYTITTNYTSPYLVNEDDLIITSDLGRLMVFK